MKHYFALVLAFVWPLCANAIQDQVMHLKGVTITATHSATRLCGMDFLIAVSDGDQHLVKINYSYNGTFKDNSIAEDVPMNLLQATRSDRINISVGRNTMEGDLARVAAPEFPYGSLVCRLTWAFHFTASEYNATQVLRDEADERKRKEQEKIDEANRKKAEEAAKKLAYQQKLQQIKDQQAKSEYDRFEAYRSANESVCGAMIMQSDYVAACERRKAVHNDEQIRERAASTRVREVDAARQRVEQDSNAEVARLTQVMEANNCSYGGGLSSQIPYPAWTSAMGSQEEYAAEKKRIDALNWEAQQKFFQATKAASDACDARRANKRAIEQQREEALRLQAEQERRLLAQKKARADLDAAIQEGKKTVSEAENNTQTMQNDNADLLSLINNMDKKQSVAEAKAPKLPPQTVSAGNNGSSASNGGEVGVCTPDEGLFQSYVEAYREWVRHIDWAKPASVSDLRNHFKDIYEQHVHNHPLEQLQEKLEFRKKDLARFTSTSPQAPKIRAEERIFIQLTECEINRLKNQKKPVVQTSAVEFVPKTKEEKACKVEIDRLIAEKDRNEKLLNKGEVVRLSELTMWFISKSVAVIDRVCPQSVNYRKEREYAQQQYKELQRVCDAHASSPPCKPRLPGKEPVATPQNVATPLPPLKDKPKGDCGKPPSASAIKCLEEKCAPEKLQLGANGCYFCSTRDTGNFWSACPDGRNVAQ